MVERIKVTASLVAYKEDAEELTRSIESFINYDNATKLYLIENYQNDLSNEILSNPKIERIKTGSNLGFGAGHNLVLNKINTESDYHLILNPDVDFDSNILKELIDILKKDLDLAMIAPKVFFPNGQLQHSYRRYPSLFELFIRRVPVFKTLFKNVYLKGVYADLNVTKPFYAEYLTGCFHLYKTKDFLRLKGFDERYFLYMEDVDICKKIDTINKKKMYYPNVSITHVLKQGSSKRMSLFLRHLISMIKYFNKWAF